MPSDDTQRPGREPGDEDTSLARETEELGRGGAARDTLHPAPPAEGKWRGILGQVRGLLARRRADPGAR